MKTYKSKIGFKTLIILGLLFGGIIVFMVYQNEPIEAILSAGGRFLLVYGICIYLNFSTEYIITEAGTLNVKSGFFYNKHFDINNINSVAKTGNLISSPAPSLDRIELAYGKFDLIVISTRDQNGFIRDLKKINPKIENKLPE